jgi:hypothetical protein
MILYFIDDFSVALGVFFYAEQASYKNNIKIPKITVNEIS